ncbi:hypothetical protein [Saccharospirillum impatiens]|uniref:hypothetical protein n=1 Tax=Saccharospirillum impatiens TaxID=169438 RepID=UPI0012FC421B|nr:hypothetical protein [Saccharospirillum impatiens]
MGGLLLALLLFLLFWLVTVPGSSAPRTIIPFSDLSKYRQWLDDYHPARLESGQTVALSVQQDDVQKLAILLASTQAVLTHTQFRARITPDALQLEAWYPTRWLDRFLPLQLTWSPDEPFRLQRFWISGVAMPGWIVSRINERLAEVSAVRDAEQLWQTLSPVIEMGDGSLTFSTEWTDPELTGWLNDFAPFWSGSGQRERLVEEVEWVREFFIADGRQRIPLRDLLIALAERPNLDFNQDGSAVFGALSYATLGSVSGMRPGVDLPRMPGQRLTLHGRYDLARHYTLAMWLGTQMNPDAALELATYKEWSDAETRSSGFSAEDMVANVAGLEMLGYLRRIDAQTRKGFRPATDDRLMPSRDFWEPWLSNGAALNERQLRELIESTREQLPFK